jgi:hypothetical protein
LSAATSVERKSGVVIMTNGDGGRNVIEMLTSGNPIDRLLAM